MRSSRNLGLLLLFFAATLCVRAETGSEAWLRYAPITEPSRYATLPSRILVLPGSPADLAAANELQRGLTSMLGRPFTIVHGVHGTDAIIVTNLASLTRAGAAIFTFTGDKLPPEAFTLGEKVEGKTHR